jgi:hypothetical protein
MGDMKMGRLRDFFQRIKYELRCSKIFRQPRWLYYNIGENGYYPFGKELLVRGLINAMIFVAILEAMFYLTWWGLTSPVFWYIKEIGKLYGQQELTWLVYGVVIGISGSLLFGTIQDHHKSILLRIETSCVFLLYYVLFFVTLNLFLLAIVIMS